MNDAPKARRVKFARLIHRYLIWQHRWTGLLMAAFLSVVGITGSLLVYTTEIERLIDSQFFAKPQPGSQQLEMGEIAERVEAEEPKIRVGYFFRNIPDTVLVRVLPRTDSTTGRLYKVDFDHLYADPWTGRVLAHRMNGDLSELRMNVMPFIRSIHTDLVSGPPGALVLGYVALVWTIDCFVGFYLTLPLTRGIFWRRWGTAWWVKWKASGYRVNFDLHRAGGLWFWPLLFIFAWSSVNFELPTVYDKVMIAAVSYQTPADMLAQFQRRSNERPKLNWREAEARAREVVRQEAQKNHWRILRPGSLAYIAELGVYSYGVQTDRDLRANNPDTGVWIDGDTGELQHVFLARPTRLGNTFTNLIIGLHFADYKGWQSYRLLEFVLGLLITVLSVTGIVIWWKKRRVRIMTRIASRRRISVQTQPARTDCHR